MSERASNCTPDEWPGIDDQRKLIALKVCSEGGSVQDAHEAAGVSARTFFRWRDEDAFSAAWKQALRAGVGPLLKELQRRAFAGADDPQSLNALKLSLQFRDRELAENTKIEHTGSGGGIMSVIVQHSPLLKEPELPDSTLLPEHKQ